MRGAFILIHAPIGINVPLTIEPTLGDILGHVGGAPKDKIGADKYLDLSL